MRSVLLLLACLVGGVLSAQTATSIAAILNIPPKKIAIYLPTQGFDQLSIATAYGSATITDPGQVDALEGKQITHVALVYSQYQRSSSFSQPGLNKQRLQHLQQLLPQAFNDPLVNWSVYAQHCNDYEACQQLFHGFVITYRQPANEVVTEDEIDYILDYLSQDATVDYMKVDKGSKSLIADGSLTIISKGFKNKQVVKTDTLTGKWDELENALDPKNLPKTWAEFDSVHRSIIMSGSEVAYTRSGVPDSTIFKVFSRNTNWDKMLIVSDVTGSMAPYTSQLLLWYKLKALDELVRHFVFFNDGDQTPDEEKLAGATGGIYYGEARAFTDIENLVYETMRAGNGGDVPENNLEALKAGLLKCPDCEEVVMIVDNFASPRDLNLVADIKVPVRIIVCGAHWGINPDYLELARNTGGSIHTIEQDLTELVKLKEGEQVEVEGKLFYIHQGKFKPVIGM